MQIEQSVMSDPAWGAIVRFDLVDIAEGDVVEYRYRNTSDDPMLVVITGSEEGMSEVLIDGDSVPADQVVEGWLLTPEQHGEEVSVKVRIGRAAASTEVQIGVLRKLKRAFGRGIQSLLGRFRDRCRRCKDILWILLTLGTSGVDLALDAGEIVFDELAERIRRYLEDTILDEIARELSAISRALRWKGNVAQYLCEKLGYCP